MSFVANAKKALALKADSTQNPVVKPSSVASRVSKFSENMMKKLRQTERKSSQTTTCDVLPGHPDNNAMRNTVDTTVGQDLETHDSSPPNFKFGETEDFEICIFKRCTG